MRKHKRRDEGKQTLNMRIYSMISVDTKAPLVHIGKSLTKSIAYRSPSLFWKPLDLPQRLDHKGSHQVFPLP